MSFSEGFTDSVGDASLDEARTQLRKFRKALLGVMAVAPTKQPYTLMDSCNEILQSAEVGTIEVIEASFGRPLGSIAIEEAGQFPATLIVELDCVSKHSGGEMYIPLRHILPETGQQG